MSYTQENLNNPVILKLAEKIQVNIDERSNREFPEKNSCIVSIQTTSRKNTVRIEDPKGNPLNLCTIDDIKDKFYRNATPLLGKKRSEDLYSYLSQFDIHPNLNDLKKLTLIPKKYD